VNFAGAAALHWLFPLPFLTFFLHLCCDLLQLEETDAAAGSKRRRASITIPL